MNILLAVIVLVAVIALTVAAMLVVRRRAPEGSYFQDGDRASGVFGVLATGFSVLLGFIIFLAFSSYDESRQGAETEATIVAQQVQTAQFLPEDSSAEGYVGCSPSQAAPASSEPSPGSPRLRSASPCSPGPARVPGPRHPPGGSAVADCPAAAARRRWRRTVKKMIVIATVVTRPEITNDASGKSPRARPIS